MEDGSAELRQVFDDLVRFETRLWDAVDARLRADHDLTLGSFETMQVVARTAGCRVNDIADALSITVGGVSKIVDRLEAAGRVRRLPNPDDRRSSVIGITPPALRLMTAATVTFTDELRRRLPLDPDELHQLAATLTRLRSHR